MHIVLLKCPQVQIAFLQWQSGFSRVYSNCCCSCSFEPEIIKNCQSSHKMCSNNIVNFQESTTILNAHTKKVWKIIVCTSYIYMHAHCIYINIYIYILYIYIYIRTHTHRWDIYIYIHTHTHTHTHIGSHTHTHTCVYMCQWCNDYHCQE